MFPNLIMQKKSVLPVLSILLINFVSAFSHYGYNRFSITGFFSSINPDDMILMTLFIIIFAFINFSLGKFFKDSYGQPNKATAGVVAFAVTSLIIYGFWRTGFDLGGLFYNVGISEDTLFFIMPIVLLVAAIFIAWKVGFAALFLIFGLLIILITRFTDLIYEKGIALIIGFVLFLIGLWLWWRKRRGVSGYGGGSSGWFGSSPNYDYGGGKQKSPGWFGRYDPDKDIRAAKAVGRGVAATGRGAWKAGKWVRSKYDFERDKRQAKAIAKGVGWAGKKAWGGAKGIGKGAVQAGKLAAQKAQEIKQRREIEKAHAEALKENERRKQLEQQKNDMTGLKQEYKNLIEANKKLVKQNIKQGGRGTPAKGTPLGNQWQSNFQRMKQIEALLRR